MTNHNSQPLTPTPSRSLANDALADTPAWADTRRAARLGLLALGLGLGGFFLWAGPARPRWWSTPSAKPCSTSAAA